MRKKPQRKLYGHYTFTFYESMIEFDKPAWNEVLLNTNFF